MSENLKKENSKKLDYKKMIRCIDDLVNNDFGSEMEFKILPRSKPYTQEEAKKMSRIISKIYSIAHCISCETCAQKYAIRKTS